MIGTAKRCRHCGQSKASRPRGLCWNCYYMPGVKDVYCRKGLGLGNPQRGTPPTATSAAPGSEAKIAIFQERVAAGFSLWHPDDAPLDLK